MTARIADPQAVQTSTRWFAAAVSDLLWVESGDEFILFHRPSGKTHFVNRAAFLLLDQVLREPRDLARAIDELALAQDAPVIDDFAQDVAALIGRLDELGLVEPA